MSVLKRRVVKLEKEEKIVLWLKSGQSHVCLECGGRGWQIVTDVRTYTTACPQVERKKIILPVFMGNLILNLLSLDHKWSAWLARFRYCGNYSTAIYYRFSFVLCCSNWHQTLVGRGQFFSVSTGMPVSVKVLQSHKRAVLLLLKLLCSLSHVCA